MKIQAADYKPAICSQAHGTREPVVWNNFGVVV